MALARLIGAAISLLLTVPRLIFRFLYLVLAPIASVAARWASLLYDAVGRPALAWIEAHAPPGLGVALRLFHRALSVARREVQRAWTEAASGWAEQGARVYRLLRGTGSGVFVASLAAVVVGFLIGNLLWRFLLALEPSFDGLDANDDARRFWRRPALNWVGRTYLARRPELVPAFLRTPDFERSQWLSTTLDILWPHINRAADLIVDRNVETTINRVLAARFASLGLPAPLLVIEAADLGTAPPRVQGARVLSPYADVTPLEMSVAWGSNARLRAALCFPVAGAVVVRVPCEVQDVVFLGTVRALVRWSPKFPCVASVDLTLPAPPSLDFALRIPGVPFDLISTPFIGDAIKRIVDAVLSRMLLYPQTLHVPLFDRSYQPPVGLVQVRVLRASHVYNPLGWLDIPDPYVRMSVSGATRGRSSTKAKTTAPAWDEDFYLIVHDLTNDVLEVELMDDNFGVIRDGLITRCSLPLKSHPAILQPGRWVDETAMGGSRRWRGGAATSTAKHTPPHPHAPSQPPPQQQQQPPPPLRPGDEGVVSGDGKHGPPEKSRSFLPNILANQTQLFFQVRYLPLKKAGGLRGTAGLGAGGSAGGNVGSSGDAGGSAGAGGVASREGVVNVKAQAAGSVHGGARLNGVGSGDDAGFAELRGRGILHVEVTRCSGLLNRSVDPMVRLRLVDPERGPLEERTRVEVDTANPVFHESFSFAHVSEGAVLHLEVVNKNLGITAKLTKIIRLTSPLQQSIGEMSVPVSQVARSGRLQGDFPLQKVPRGVITLDMRWDAIEIDTLALRGAGSGGAGAGAGRTGGVQTVAVEVEVDAVHV